MNSILFELESAWKWRENLGYFDESQSLRIFHGSGEGSETPLKSCSIDRFGDHYWVDFYQKNQANFSEWLSIEPMVLDFLDQKKARSVVLSIHLERGSSKPLRILRGTINSPFPTSEKLNERCIAHYWIHFDSESKHPGLFLDHFPLRAWLSQNVRGLRVLNTFSYTGSLSLSAALGGASQVTSLDLSGRTLEWSKENFILNKFNINDDRFTWIKGDVFEWLSKFNRKKTKFDCIILDPPSFSRGKTGDIFSTTQNLPQLHQLAMQILSQDGYLITSINSFQISKKKFELDILKSCPKKWVIHRQIDLPETFPTLLGDENSRYLKGWILKASTTSSQ